LKKVAILITISSDFILPSVSSFERLTRIIAYCLKFVKGCRCNRQVGNLTVRELEKAEQIIARVVQHESFHQEYRCLSKGHVLKKNSKLITLDPFLDEMGLIRVGGRLRHADLPEETKHPIVLPSKHHLTSLILREEHLRLHHCGVEQLLASSRRKYWKVSGRREARKITRSCLDCFKLNPSSIQVKMGDMPKEKVIGYLRPFAISGVDYAGPLTIKESHRRGRVPTSKAYIALFVCLNTRAIPGIGYGFNH